MLVLIFILPFKFYRLSYPQAYYMPYSDLSLDRVLARSAPSPWFDNTAKALIIYGIACALAHLHTQNAFHGYLSPKRVQLSQDHTPQLTDYAFGHMNRARSGDDLYAPPGEPPSQARDVFQFGVLVWLILMGKERPTRGITHGQLGKFPFLQRVVKHCMAANPERRPTVPQILAAMGREQSLLPGVDPTKYDRRAQEFFKVVFDRARPCDRALYERMEQEAVAAQTGPALVKRGKELFTAGKHAEALALLEQAVNAGYLPARCWHAIAIMRKDEREGHRRLRDAAEQGDPDAMYELGSFLNKQNNPDGIRWLQAAAKAGVVEALCFLARHYETTGNFPEARETYRQAADQGNESALVDYARTLTDRRFGEVDGEEAIRCLEQAVAKGSKEAMYTLAVLYREGRGCEKNIEKMVDYYERAAQLKYPPACARLAFLYMPNDQSGPTGVEPNVPRAVELYKIAIEAGDLQAMHNYAAVLSGQLGDHVPKDMPLAVELWKKAADGKVAVSQFRYGECAEKGTGMPRNIETACHYYGLAAAQKNPKAIEALKRLGKWPR